MEATKKYPDMQSEDSDELLPRGTDKQIEAPGLRPASVSAHTQQQPSCPEHCPHRDYGWHCFCQIWELQVDDFISG